MMNLFMTGMGATVVREPAVAGTFYPDEPARLVEMIDRYLAGAEKVIEGEVGGVVVPHAGYVYSGPVAAWSFKQIEGANYPYVIVLAPSHFEYFEGASVFNGEYYRTPLGDIPVATELAIQLTRQHPLIRISELGHRVEFSDRGEHSLEVELPFLQRVLGDFQLIPIVMGSQNWATCEATAKAIATVFADKKVLVVASSDLSHYHPYEAAYQIDERLIELFENYDYRQILELNNMRKVEACGAGPIATVMFAAQLLGYNKSRVMKYATSGDVPHGEKYQVVGYMAGVLYK